MRNNKKKLGTIATLKLVALAIFADTNMSTLGFSYKCSTNRSFFFRESDFMKAISSQVWPSSEFIDKYREHLKETKPKIESRFKEPGYALELLFFVMDKT